MLPQASEQVEHIVLRRIGNRGRRAGGQGHSRGIVRVDVYPLAEFVLHIDQTMLSQNQLKAQLANHRGVSQIARVKTNIEW